jgi:hypothetical protein
LRLATVVDHIIKMLRNAKTTSQDVSNTKSPQKATTVAKRVLVTVLKHILNEIFSGYFSVIEDTRFKGHIYLSTTENVGEQSEQRIGQKYGSGTRT